MPLSEHEQQLLAQMEQALAAEDPKFASQMQGAVHPARSRRVAVGGLGVLVGIALVVAGVSTQLVLLGVVGFALMVAGAAYALTPPRPVDLAALASEAGGSGRPGSGLTPGVDDRSERD